MGTRPGPPDEAHLGFDAIRPRNRFIGREEELRALEELATPGSVLSITGLPGVGKTRLACEWAWSRCQARSNRGATVLAASPSDGHEALVARLHSLLAARPLHTLVVDGAEDPEGLPEALSQVLQHHPGVRVLVTSRREMALPGLVLGPLGTRDSRALFVARAPRAIEVGAGVLDRLGGLPLAIELAAARLELLSLSDLEQRLSRPLDVLGGPGGPSIRSTIATSWSLLAEAERSALSQCTVFRGSIPLDGAEAVLDVDGHVLDVLHALVRQSLLQRLAQDEDNEARFVLHDLVREYAAEALVDASAAETRHRRWFEARVAEWTEDGLHRDRDATARLERDYPNLRVIVDRCEDPDDRLRAVLPLAWCLGHRLFAEDELNLLKLIEAACDPVLRAQGQLRRVSRLRNEGRMEEARQLMLSQLDVPDLRTRAHIIGALGEMESQLGDLERAAARFEEALDAGRRAGDLRLQALALAALSSCVDLRVEGDLEAALEKRLKAVELCVQCGDSYLEAAFRARLSQTLNDLGRPAEGLAEAERGLELAPARMDPEWANLVFVAASRLGLGDPEAAQEVAEQAMAWLDRHRRPDTYRILVFHVLALAAFGRSELAEAREQLDACEALPGLHGRRYEDFLAVTLRIRAALEQGPAEEHEGPPTWQDRILERIARQAAEAMRVCARGTWFEPPGKPRVSVARRRVLRPLLARLVASGGGPVPAEALMEAVWPGERQGDAVRNRLYVALNSLRRLGLEPLVHSPEGYRIDGVVRVVSE